MQGPNRGSDEGAFGVEFMAGDFLLVIVMMLMALKVRGPCRLEKKMVRSGNRSGSSFLLRR